MSLLEMSHFCFDIFKHPHIRFETLKSMPAENNAEFTKKFQTCMIHLQTRKRYSTACNLFIPLTQRRIEGTVNNIVVARSHVHVFTKEVHITIDKILKAWSL